LVKPTVTSPKMSNSNYNHPRRNQQQDQQILLDTNETPITGSSTNSSSSNLVEPDIQFREYFKKNRTDFSVNTIPYDRTIKYSKHKDDGSYEPNKNLNRKKCTVVVIGHVGSALVYNLINRDLCGIIAMISPDDKQLKAVAEDFQQGLAFFPSSIVISALSKYDITANSDLIFVTVGAAPTSGGSRKDGLKEGVSLLNEIIPQVISYSPTACIMIVSNPVDILTAVATRIAGPTFPPGRIFGTGTYLDTSRFKTIIANSAGIDPGSAEGFIIGEHGPNSIPVWSSVRLGPLPLLSPNQEPDDTLKAIHQTVADNGWDVVDGKGYTNWAIDKLH
jgi:L-lactate dehydrogenase